MDQEAMQERHRIEAQRAKANLLQWKREAWCLHFVLLLGFFALLVVGFVTAAQVGLLVLLAWNACLISALLCVLALGGTLAIVMPFTTKAQRLEHAWLSTYGTEVMATITAQREVPSSSGEGISLQLQLTWSPSTGGETLSFWESVTPMQTKKYPPGTNVWLHYDPADLSFHRIRWQGVVDAYIIS